MTTFIPRHIGPTGTTLQELLEGIGASDLDEVLTRAVPASVLHDTWDEGLPQPHTPTEVMARLEEFANKNVVNTSLLDRGITARAPRP